MPAAKSWRRAHPKTSPAARTRTRGVSSRAICRRSFARVIRVIARRGRGGTDGGRGWGDAGGEHRAVDCLDRFDGRLEVARAETFRDHQRGPAVLIFAVPDVD